MLRFLIAALALGVQAALAQGYPSKPIHPAWLGRSWPKGSGSR